MKLSPKAQAALDNVIKRFQSGDLSPVVEIIRLRRPETPSSKWTLSNQILAYIQADSLDCRGYRQWQQVGRHVRKGSHAAFILAPCLITVEDETGEKKQILRGFRGMPVFAYHDTEGEDLPEADYTPRELPPLVEAAKRLGVKITWQPTPADRLGDCSTDGQRIHVGTHDQSVFFHELAHAAHAKIEKLKGGQHPGQETIADFTACVLMELYGFSDRSGNTWQYISHYAKDPLQAIVKALAKVEQVLEILEV
jgi:hypothetical protein